MTKIIALSGSLRKKSFNTALLRTASQVAGDDIDIDVATLHDIPLYNGDLEKREGIPSSVNDLRTRIEAADGLLIATPEYNSSIPGVLKNGIDWLSRRPDERPHVFSNLPIAVIGASPGGFGTILAQNAWQPVLRTLSTQAWFGGRLMVSKAGNVFDDDGQLTDDDVRKRLKSFVEGFAAFAASRR